MISFNAFAKAEQPKIKFDKLVSSHNLAEDLSPELRDHIGIAVVSGYDKDLSTRQEWDERNAMGIKLALQIMEQKSFPWVGCSNVKFPLITVAALQFLARVSLMTKGNQLVKLDVIGQDPEGHREMQAARIASHINLQMTHQDRNWLTEDEKCKFAASIIGSAFKKTYFDSVEGINVSEYVPAQNFVVDYYCKDLLKADRATHLILMNANDVQERVRRGVFLDVTPGEMARVTATPSSVNILKQLEDEAAGINKPVDDENTPAEMLEQYTWLDLDGDGYAEPYTVTVRRDTRKLYRIVARFFDNGDVLRVNDSSVRMLEQKLMDVQDELKKLEINNKQSPAQGMVDTPATGDLKRLMDEQSRLEKRIDELESAASNHIVRIIPEAYFTKYPFIPSPDGSFYDLGLGALIGPSNAAVNTTLNQLIDSGTMSNMQSGFLGRGVKMKGGLTNFQPGEWKPVDSTGNDLKNNIVPLPTKEPSMVLFQLLGLLIGYAEKISGSTDIMTGVSPGQNTPAETSRNTIEQGMMLFSGIYNRMYRAFTAEIGIFYRLNQLYFKQSQYYVKLTKSGSAIVAPDDYDDENFLAAPAASPEATSTSQRRAKAKNTLDLAMASPGMDLYLAKKKYLEAWEEEDIDRLLPDPKGKTAIPAPPNPKMLELQQKQKEHEDHMQISIIEMKQQAMINEAKIGELQAKAVKLMSEAEGVATGHEIAMIDAQIGAAKAQQEGVLKSLELLQKAHAHQGQIELEHKKLGASHGNTARSGGMGASSGDTGIGGLS